MADEEELEKITQDYWETQLDEETKGRVRKADWVDGFKHAMRFARAASERYATWNVPEEHRLHSKDAVSLKELKGGK